MKLTKEEIKVRDRLFNFIMKCNRNAHVPDLHSFTIKINKGIAFVECRGHQEVYIETRTYGEEYDKVENWCGTPVAAANRLNKLKADLNTIDM